MKLLNDYLSEIQIGKHSEISDSKFDPEELRMGIEIEKEHTDNLETAKKIAKDHLSEFPRYYSRLKQMEKTARKQNKKYLK